MREGFRGFIEDIIESLKGSWAAFLEDMGANAEIWVDQIKAFFSRKEPAAEKRREIPEAWLQAVRKYLDDLRDRGFIDIAAIPETVRHCATIEIWTLLKEYHKKQVANGHKLSPTPDEKVIEKLFRSALLRCADRE
ncbi:MAG TPA: hypothetical protein VHE55_02545 [Fimbriimonadaceae bacterium]|nr:hypothetical protein [Fimbriimonadaceae bacterium]